MPVAAGWPRLPRPPGCRPLGCRDAGRTDTARLLPSPRSSRRGRPHERVAIIDLGSRARSGHGWRRAWRQRPVAPAGTRPRVTGDGKHTSTPSTSLSTPSDVAPFKNYQWMTYRCVTTRCCAARLAHARFVGVHAPLACRIPPSPETADATGAGARPRCFPQVRTQPTPPRRRDHRSPSRVRGRGAPPARKSGRGGSRQ